MTEETGTLTICAPAGSWWRSVFRCRSCRRDRRFVVRHTPYYGSYSICLACGYECGDDAPARRRSWLQRSALVIEARETWKTARPLSEFNPENEYGE